MFNKKLNKYSIILLFAIGLVIMLLLNVYTTINELSAVAQTDKQQDLVTLDNNSAKEDTTISKQTSHSGTFYASGEISSLNFESNSIMDIANSKKTVLSGHWSLYIIEGYPSFFEADFIAAPSDGGISHTHQIVNLLYSDTKDNPIYLASDGSVSINGSATIKLNGMDVWKGVKMAISISKGSSITIAIDDIDTEHHFTEQPIYGIVNRLVF
jgi:hypothetical protein